MGHENNQTEVGKLAWKLYIKKVNKDPKIHEHAADWWFHNYPEQFREEYKEANIILRNKKIKNILNGKN